VSCETGGKMRWLAMYQVAGKPMSITEYNHSWPNTSAGEAPLYLAVHGARQGWDALYLFAYGHDADYLTNTIRGLDIRQHPTQLANLPIAALIFRRGDLTPLASVRQAPLPPDRELELAATKGGSWNLANGFKAGLDANDILRHRLELVVDPAATLVTAPRYAGGFRWGDDQAAQEGQGDTAVLRVDTRRTKAAFGHLASRLLVFGDGVAVRVGPTAAGTATCAVSLLGGDSFSAPRQALVVVTAAAANTGQAWKRSADADGQSRWEITDCGRAPTCIETVAVDLELPAPRGLPQVFRLDERGQRAEALTVTASNPGRAAVALGRSAPALAYAVEWEP